jgi:hypothetical protein
MRLNVDEDCQNERVECSSMKKLLLLATAISAVALVPAANAGFSFGISIGHRSPVYVAPPVCAPPVYVAPAPICPPVYAAPRVIVAPRAYYAPPPRVVHYGRVGHGWKHQHRHYRHDNRHHYRHGH